MVSQIYYIAENIAESSTVEKIIYSESIRLEQSR